MRAVVAGGVLLCGYGTSYSPLLIAPGRTVRIGGRAMAIVTDFLAGPNVTPFGLCLKTLTPCDPELASPWVGSVSIFVEDIMVLPNNATLRCEVGPGTIYVADPAQASVEIANSRRIAMSDPTAASKLRAYDRLVQVDAEQKILSAIDNWTNDKDKHPIANTVDEVTLGLADAFAGYESEKDAATPRGPKGKGGSKGGKSAKWGIISELYSTARESQEYEEQEQAADLAEAQDRVNKEIAKLKADLYNK